MLLKSLKTSCCHLPSVLREGVVFFIGIAMAQTLLRFAGQLHLEHAVELSKQSPYGSLFLGVFLGLLDFVLSLVFTFVLASLVYKNMATPQSFSLNQFFIESVRGLASIIWRVPLLIFPAFYKFITLLYLPLVVILDKDYQDGQVDALKRCSQMTQGQWLGVFLVWLFLQIPTSLFSPDLWISQIAQEIPAFVVLSFFEFAVSIFCSSLLLIYLYEKSPWQTNDHDPSPLVQNYLKQ